MKALLTCVLAGLGLLALLATGSAQTTDSGPEASRGLGGCIIAPPPDHFEVERKRKTFYVHGEGVERLAVMTDLTSDEALHRLQRRFLAIRGG